MTKPFKKNGRTRYLGRRLKPAATFLKYRNRLFMNNMQVDFVIFVDGVKHTFGGLFQFIRFIGDQDKSESVESQIVPFCFPCSNKERQDTLYWTCIVYFQDIYEKSVPDFYFVAQYNFVIQFDVELAIYVFKHFLRTTATKDLLNKQFYRFSVKNHRPL